MNSLRLKGPIKLLATGQLRLLQNLDNRVQVWDGEADQWCVSPFAFGQLTLELCRTFGAPF